MTIKEKVFDYLELIATIATIIIVPVLIFFKIKEVIYLHNTADNDANSIAFLFAFPQILVLNFILIISIMHGIRRRFFDYLFCIIGNIYFEIIVSAIKN